MELPIIPLEHGLLNVSHGRGRLLFRPGLCCLASWFVRSTPPASFSPHLEVPRSPSYLNLLKVRS
ncbi:uncharacterized protein PgNI_09825 [Pyricularia grisea]|uniref:Uncharacterized protein n=1 Tax=Pyricularia grisea TaxID=148305 RepID=A0A6P8ASD9_PYRGI|nr:uncharacterized protein PgNI_09825 [Pyricularia grisea]TLD05023.1 hypothetical protein PgNI_09825 [Pyricularia grisea]